MSIRILFLGRESPLWIGLDEKQRDVEFKRGYSGEMSYVIEVMKKNKIDFKTHFFEIGNDFSTLSNIFKKSGANIVFCDFYNNLANSGTKKWIFSELERQGIPHYLSTIDTMNLMYDKILCQKKLKSSGIEVLPFMGVGVNDVDNLNEFLKTHKKIILKPTQCYSSKGIAVFEDIHLAINHTMFLKEHYSEVIAEKFLDRKREFQILIIGKKPLIFPVEVGIPLGKVYDRDMKEEHYKRYAIKSLDIYDKLIKLGKKIYDIFGIRDLARIDVISNSNNKLYPIDVNDIPYLAKINPNSGKKASLTQTGKIYGRSYDSLIMEVLGLF